MSLTVGTDAHDGDLRQCLSKCHELIIKHCIGKLGMTTLSDLVDLATEADYAENLKKTSWKLRTSWKLTYPNISFDEFMTAADGITARNFREAIEAAIQDTKVEWAMNNATTRATEVNLKKRDATVIKSTGQPTMPEKRQKGQGKEGNEQPKKVTTATCLQGGKPICKKRNDDRGCTKREQDCPDKRAHKCDVLVNGRACGKENCFRWKH
jgi:hypothetical protein